MTAPNAPMSACVHHDFSILDAYVRNLRWSPDTPKEVREAVASNLRGLYSHLLARGLFAGSGSWDDGRTAAAKWVEARRCEYGEKFGVVDPATGALEFGSGYPEREEYYNELSVIEEAVRSLPAPQFVGHKDSAPMSAEEAMMAMTVAANIIRDACPCTDPVSCDDCDISRPLRDARTAVAAMAEREAALVARIAKLEESFARAGLNAREAQTKAHEATIALSTAKAEIARLELVQVPALVKEVEARGKRIVELEEDFRRIEWLALNPRGASITVDGKARPCVFWGVSSAPENTLRQAIDAARAEARDV